MQVYLMQRPLSQPPPWKMGLSFPFFFFSPVFHLRKFKLRMSLLFPPLDLISCVVSESAQWELRAGQQIAGAGAVVQLNDTLYL
jgi:hypothetical protein